MITVDREKARAYINEILKDSEPPFNKPVTEEELDAYIEMVTDTEHADGMFFYWLDDMRYS